MKKVSYQSLQKDGKTVVQFHFHLPRGRKYWYDRNVQPFVDVITDSIPHFARKESRETASWEISDAYWPATMIVLQACKFDVVNEPTEMRVERWWELAELSFVLTPFIFAQLAINSVFHLFGSKDAIPVRPVFEIMVFLLLFVSTNARNHVISLACISLAILFDPIWPIRINPWWLWNLIDWTGLCFFVLSALLLSMDAERDQKMAHWWVPLNR